MTIYAEVIGGVTATELPEAGAFTLSTGDQYAANWLALNSQAEREALNIYPITDDATPGIEYTVTGSTLEVGGGGTTVQRHWTTDAKTANALLTELLAELDATQALYSFDNVDVPIGAAESDLQTLYRSNTVAQLALAFHAGLAARAIDAGALADELDWCPDGQGGTITTFTWPNIFDVDIEKDAFEMLEMQASFGGRMRWSMKVHTHYLRAMADARDVDDIPAMLTLRDEFLTSATWLVPYP